jgi:hypothetical protein
MAVSSGYTIPAYWGESHREQGGFISIILFLKYGEWAKNILKERHSPLSLLYSCHVPACVWPTDRYDQFRCIYNKRTAH